MNLIFQNLKKKIKELIILYFLKKQIIINFFLFFIKRINLESGIGTELMKNDFHNELNRNIFFWFVRHHIAYWYIFIICIFKRNIL